MGGFSGLILCFGVYKSSLKFGVYKMYVRFVNHFGGFRLYIYNDYTKIDS